MPRFTMPGGNLRALLTSASDMSSINLTSSFGFSGKASADPINNTMAPFLSFVSNPSQLCFKVLPFVKIFWRSGGTLQKILQKSNFKIYEKIFDSNLFSLCKSKKLSSENFWVFISINANFRKFFFTPLYCYFELGHFFI